MRWLLTSLFALLLTSACTSRSNKPPPRGQPNTWVGTCGIQIFRTPACQSALDALCCPIEMECAKDPGCVGVAQCINQCKATTGGQAADNCMNGCAVRARYDYCQAVCRGQGPDCVTVCGQRGGPAEPARKWALIADCSKNVSYPNGVRCDDGT